MSKTHRSRYGNGGESHGQIEPPSVVLAVSAEKSPVTIDAARRTRYHTTYLDSICLCLHFKQEGIVNTNDKTFE